MVDTSQISHVNKFVNEYLKYDKKLCIAMNNDQIRRIHKFVNKYRRQQQLDIREEGVRRSHDEKFFFSSPTGVKTFLFNER